MEGPDATEKKNVGEVWAQKSGGECGFLMVGRDSYGQRIKSELIKGE